MIPSPQLTAHKPKRKHFIHVFSQSTATSQNLNVSESELVKSPHRSDFMQDEAEGQAAVRNIVLISNGVRLASYACGGGSLTRGLYAMSPARLHYKARGICQ